MKFNFFMQINKKNMANMESSLNGEIFIKW